MGSIKLSEGGPLPVSPFSHSSPLIAADHTNDGKYHLLLAASGSVATIKIPNIIRGLAHHTALSIRLVLTQSSSQFLQGQSDEQPSLSTIATLPNVDGIYLDADEWRIPWKRGAPILHIELRRWADVLVIAPLSANTLAKIANGICDNLLTSVVRAWEVQYTMVQPETIDRSDKDVTAQNRQKYILIAPAMNTMMWRHPFTAQHLRTIAEVSRGSEGMADKSEPFSWFRILYPEEMTLACGDVGAGGMKSWKDIIDAIEDSMKEGGIRPVQ